MSEIIPIAKMTSGKKLSTSLRMVQPINAAVIPKNSKLKPTITETSPAENIGEIINIMPSIIERNPAILLIIIISPPFVLYILKIL